MAERDAYEVLQVSPRAHDAVIKAAYRTLAALYHPDRDGDVGADKRMAELNRAFEAVRTPDRRRAYDGIRQPEPSPVAVNSARAPTAAAVKRGADTLDFGRYEGWTITQLAYEDPDYLKWLSRHSSGIRYRQQIDEALRDGPKQPSMSERMRGR
jgi:curved DNA-binding protein CbpA